MAARRRGGLIRLLICSVSSNRAGFLRGVAACLFVPLAPTGQVSCVELRPPTFIAPVDSLLDLDGVFRRRLVCGGARESKD